MTEYRCPVCDKLLAVGRFVGLVEVFCSRCKRLRRFQTD